MLLGTQNRFFQQERLVTSIILIHKKWKVQKDDLSRNLRFNRILHTNKCVFLLIFALDHISAYLIWEQFDFQKCVNPLAKLQSTPARRVTLFNNCIT